MAINRLRDILVELDMTQERLSERTGLAQSHISKLVNGKGIPSLRTAERVAKALGVSIEEIWGA